MLPFVQAPKESFIKVGSSDSGEIYLKSIKARKASERKALDIVDRIETQVQLFLLELAKKIADKEEISIEEAFKLVVTENTEVVKNYTSEFKKLASLSEQKNRIKDLIPTIILKERVLYPVKLAKPVKAGDEKIVLQSVSSPISVKELIKFGSLSVEVLNDVEPSSYDVEVSCEVIRGALKADSIGFLCDRFGQVKVGAPEFDSIPEIVLGVITNLGESQSEFLENIKSFPLEYREIFLESLSNVGFTEELQQDILLRFRTYNLRGLSEELLAAIIEFYNRETKGQSSEDSEKKV